LEPKTPSFELIPKTVAARLIVSRTRNDYWLSIKAGIMAGIAIWVIGSLSGMGPGNLPTTLFFIITGVYIGESAKFSYELWRIRRWAQKSGAPFRLMLEAIGIYGLHKRFSNFEDFKAPQVQSMVLSWRQSDDLKYAQSGE
jgi:hypothetical protein